MATGRMLRKQISLSEQVNDLSLKSALLYTWMLAHADDWGRMYGSPRRIKAAVVPMRADITVDEVAGALFEMQDQELIELYDDPNTGEPCLQFPSWDTHQSGLHKRTASKFPPALREVPGSSGEYPPNRTEQNGTELEPNSKDEYSAEFESFWSVYPRKVAKKATWQRWGTVLRLKRGDPETVIRCARHYAMACDGKDAQYIMHGTTFLGPQERWRDYLQPPTPEVNVKISRAAKGLLDWMSKGDDQS